MNGCTEFWVSREDIRSTQIVQHDLSALPKGSVRAAVDFVALTSNNVSYAVTGDSLGYWRFFPVEDRWGIVPAWGCADVVESRIVDISVGERLWGYFPMASHVDLVPGEVRADEFRDVSQHRELLPTVYNTYRRTSAEPDFLTQMEMERSLLFPLFITSFLIYDYLVDNDFFGARQVVIGSVSSKTALGLALLLHGDERLNQRIVGFTSPANSAFVENLGCCDTILAYGQETEVAASLRTAYIDMSGNRRLTTKLHRHLGNHLVVSLKVGATHWERGGKADDLPGAKPSFFSAPLQIAKREKEWGPGVAMARGAAASAELARQLANVIKIEWTRDVAAIPSLWLALLNNRIPAWNGQLVSFRQ